MYRGRGQYARRMMIMTTMPPAQELTCAVAQEHNWPDYLPPPERVLAKVDAAVCAGNASLYDPTLQNYDDG